MPNEKKSYRRWAGGIADSIKENAAGQIPDSYYFSRAVDHRTDPNSLTLLPRAIKESGSVVTDLLKDGDLVPSTLTSYFVGDGGGFYSRSNAGTWSLLGTIPGSHGNGLSYFSGDDYLYLLGDSNISRYGPVQNTPQLYTNFLSSQGGVPLNTSSLVLVAASSQYATAADSVTLSVTGDMTLETFFKCNSLPTTSTSMTLMGKWDESGTTRSYKLDLTGVSNYFGNGQDGSKTISSNTTDTPVDSTCTGTVGTQTLSATNASFVAGQVIFITQTQGTNAGQWERNTIQSYTAGTITTGTALLGTYTSGAQVMVVKQYTTVTVNSGKTWTAKAWNGATGGYLVFLANSTFSNSGIVTATGTGFRGSAATRNANPIHAKQELCGEGTAGPASLTASANGNGGGGGYRTSGGQLYAFGAGSGGNGTVGGTGRNINSSASGGIGGSMSGSADLTTETLGGGGGAGTGGDGGPPYGDAGGTGGGVLNIWAVTITNSGTISADGTDGIHYSIGNQVGAAGGGAGGSILLKAQTATLGTGTITAAAGRQSYWSTYQGADTVGPTTDGGVGRITLDYLTSYTGTTLPTLNPIVDTTLGSGNGTQTRLLISQNGTTFDILTQVLDGLVTGAWHRISVVWVAATSMATFYLDAVVLGTATGTKTAIHDNASLFYVGADKGASVVQNYFDGLLNDMRVISGVRTAAQIYAGYVNRISIVTPGLDAYWYFNSAYTDATANTNTLTAVNTPTFSIDVPFLAFTNRLDIDTSNTNTGQTYTLLAAISEAAVDKLTFTPVNDPQASVGFYVSAKGTGDWTVTVHDQQNRVIATSTIVTANIPASGFIEFFFANPWRLLLGSTYHMHLTVSTGTSRVVTGTTNDFSTSEYATYFGFLVTDTQFHPATQFQYQPLGGTLTGAQIWGNERYLAVWDGTNYFPNFLAFPAGWHIRCFSQWRQYLAIGVWRGGNIYDFHQGRIYFWSGYQPAYDFFIDVPEGQINALFGVDSDLYMFAGYRGNLLDYKGGYFQNTGNSSSSKLKRIPLLEPSAYSEVFPGALNMWRGILHFGLYANSNSTTAQRGVYSFGTLNQYYPESLSYDYVISTGNTGNTVSIGLVYPIGQHLIIGWRDGIAYGADQVSFNNLPAASGEVQMFVVDDNVVWREKLNLQVRADFLPLSSGESVTTEINLDRTGFYNLSTNSTFGDTHNLTSVAGGRAHEVQIGVILSATGTTSPTITSLASLHSKLTEEDNFG